MSRPEDIPQDVWDAAWRLHGLTEYDEVVARAGSVAELHAATDHDVALIARAILAERGATEARIAELLKDPAAVRLNYLRGGIACQTLIDEAVAAETERCAKIVEDLLVFADTTSDADKHIAAAIRKGGE